MEFFKKRSNEFFRGVGAEFVFKTSDGISLVSGGRILKVRIDGPLPGATASRLVLAEPDGNEHVLFEGDAVSASTKFVEIANEATSKRTPVNVSRKGAYAVLAAFTAVYLIFCHPVSQVPSQPAATQTSASDLDALLKSIPSAAGGIGKMNIPGAVNPTLPIQPSAAANSVSPVLDKPTFLELPEDEVSAVKPDDKQTKEVASAAIPAYSADLYSKPVSKAEPVADKRDAEASKPSDNAAASKATDETVSVAKTDEKPVAAPTEIAALPAAAPIEAVEVSGSKDPAASATPAEKSDAKPTSDKQDAGDAAKAAKDATKDMSAAETAELLKQIEMMMQMDPTAITPDMLEKLPHEIAQTLRDTGVIGNPEAMPEKGKAPYAAIRLPPGAIDKFRGKDGIASIPENDTFAALGNKISLQLPGGGDIRKPEDLKLFGFNP